MCWKIQVSIQSIREIGNWSSIGPRPYGFKAIDRCTIQQGRAKAYCEGGNWGRDSRGLGIVLDDFLSVVGIGVDVAGQEHGSCHGVELHDGCVAAAILKQRCKTRTSQESVGNKPLREGYGGRGEERGRREQRSVRRGGGDG